MSIQITKIKPGDRVEYERARIDKLPERCEIDFVEAARPAFYDSLKSIVTDLIKFCDLNWETGDVAELTLKHLENHQIAIAFTLEGSAKNCEGITVKSKIAADYVSPVLQVKLVDICHEAELYVKGDRKQLNLFTQELNDARHTETVAEPETPAKPRRSRKAGAASVG
jgi:hypothetical protein